MSTITTRAGKGSPLTNNEVDANFTNLNNDKLESADLSGYAELTGATFTGEVEATGFNGDLTGAILFKGQAGEALTKGDPVYISGISGNKTVVSKADANDASKMPCFGIVDATVSANADCSVVTFGTLQGLDTSSFSEGDELFVSDTGALTTTAPTGESSQIQKIGKVTRSHASAGSIKVMGAGRTNAVPNLNDGQFFLGNGSNQAVSADFTTSVLGEISAGTGIGISASGVISNTSPDQTVSLTGGTGISTSGTYPNFTITNDSPDQTVSLTGAGTTTVSGTYPNFTITGAGTTYTAGTGLSLTGTEFANTAPDQTVVLTGAGATSISGTYPNFTISSTDSNTTYTAGTGITLSGTTFSLTDTNAKLNLTGGTLTGALSGTTAQFANVGVGASPNVYGLYVYHTDNYEAAQFQTNQGGSLARFTDLTASIEIGVQSGKPVIRTGNTARLTVDGANVQINSGALQMGSTTVIDSSRNLTNIGAYTGQGLATITNSSNQHLRLAYSSGFYWDIYRESTTGDLVFDSSNTSGEFVRFDAVDKTISTIAGYKVNGTTVIDSSRNLTNIGTISSGAHIIGSDGASRVLYLRQNASNAGNIIQFQDQNNTNQWEIVGRNNGFYLYKNTGTGSGYRWQISSSGNHTITGLVNGGTLWTSANDGSGSGLDADTVDGQHETSFVRVSGGLSGDLNSSGLYRAGMFGWFNTTSNKPSDDYGQGISIVSDGSSHNNSNNWITQLGFGTGQNSAYFRSKTNSGSWGGWRTFWHTGNDGSGSGLDADLLDGQHGSYYAPASHVHSYLPLAGGTITGNLNVNGTTTLGNGNADQTHINDTLYLGATDSGDSHFYFGENSSNWYGDHWYWDSGYEVERYSRYAGTDTLIEKHDTRYTHKVQTNRAYERLSHSTGYQIGSYNSVGGNSAKTNPIYTIGDSYRPSDTSIAGMYGIGYAHSNLWGTGSGKTSGWGQYVAEAGAYTQIFSVGGTWSLGEYNRNGNKVWDAGNDGSGSGLDADLLDGIDSNRVVFGTNTSKVYRWDGDWNNMFATVNTGFIDNASGTNGNPDGFTHHHGFQVRHDNMTNAWGFQFMGSYHPSYQSLYHRNVNAGTWSSWKEIWDSGNDGSGSGLDADTVDGLHASSFLRSDARDAGVGLEVHGGTLNQNYDSTFFVTAGNNNDWGIKIKATSGKTEYGQVIEMPSSFSYAFRVMKGGSEHFNINSTGATIGGNYIWHAGNDGSGSGLDADLLDGVQGAGYVRAHSTSSGNIDADWGQTFKTFDPVPSGTPPISSPNIRTINIGDNYARRTQVAFTYNSDRAWFRRRTNSTWSSWNEFWHTGNDGSGSGLDADLLDGQHGSSYLRSNADDTCTGMLTLQRSGNTSYSTPNIFSKATSSSGGVANYHARFNRPDGTSNGHISTNYYATTYATTSDYRVKEDLQPMLNATSRLMALNPINFQWKDSDIRTDGFLAHEVAEVVSDAVVGEKDAVDENGSDQLQALDQAKLVPLLVKTIQEQQAAIAALEARIATLES